MRAPISLDRFASFALAGGWGRSPIFDLGLVAGFGFDLWRSSSPAPARWRNALELRYDGGPIIRDPNRPGAGIAQHLTTAGWSSCGIFPATRTARIGTCGRVEVGAALAWGLHVANARFATATVVQLGAVLTFEWPRERRSWFLAVEGFVAARKGRFGWLDGTFDHRMHGVGAGLQFGRRWATRVGRGATK